MTTRTELPPGTGPGSNGTRSPARGRTPPSSSAAMRPGPQARRNARAAFWLLCPALALVVTVTFLPIIRGAQISLHRTEFLRQVDFIGVQNYIDFFTAGGATPMILRTVIFTAASLALVFPLAVGLAVVLNAQLPLRTLWRTLFMLPWIVSLLLTGLMWGWLVEPNVGLLNYLVTLLVGQPVTPLGSGASAMATLVVANVWRSYPFVMILTLAALQSVSKEQLEAAEVDGAGALRRFFSITVPTIRGTLLVALIITSVNSINMVELPLIMTGGGPYGSTELLGLSAYREAFILNNFGYSAAIGVVMFAINIIVALAYIKVMRTEEQQ